MAISDVRLISRQGSSPPTTVSLAVGAIAANLSIIDRPLKKAGHPELRPFFETGDETWLQPAEMLKAFESARAFFDDPALDEILFEVVVEQLGPATDVLRALPRDTDIRLEVIKSKPRKAVKSKPVTSGARVASTTATSLVKMNLPK